MPKKRFTSQYSKPASTVHPSLNSPSTTGSSSQSRNNEAPQSTVNDLLNSFRKATISVQEHSRAAASLSPSPHTLPPQIRHLLSQPETPIPRPRRPDRSRRFDANGRRVPAGPAAPRSWLEGSIHAPAEVRARHRNRTSGTGDGRLYPEDVDYFPGLPIVGAGGMGRSLMETSLRSLANNWEEMSSWERNNLAGLPTRIRMMLLSYVAVYGPHDGLGYQALKDLLISPFEEETKQTSADTEEAETVDWEEEIYGRDPNDDFSRLDLGGSIGRSISLKQLGNLLTAKENNLTVSLPHLTHLSLSHPPPSISWPKLLALTPHLPTLTHLSLAYWPAPSMTPNSTTAVFSSPIRGRDIQYGASNFYSRSLDGDFLEGGIVLKKLAMGCYGLEYLDLEGCGEWMGALAVQREGVDWRKLWGRLTCLILKRGRVWDEPEEMSPGEKALYLQNREQAVGIGKWINKERNKAGRGWVDVIVDMEIEGSRKILPHATDDIQFNARPDILNNDLNTALVHSAWEF